MNILYWSASDTDPEIVKALHVLEEEYPFCETVDNNITLRFQKGNALSVELTEKCFTVVYDTLASALRGAGLALAGLSTQDEKCAFDMFGVMLDSSRNAVMTVPYAKSTLRRLALAGYNMVMFYTEDTYQLPDEPHFGYLRGSYSLEEIRELDDYSASLGIEMIGCIQALGHLEIFLRYAGSQNVCDTSSVLLVDEPQTYTLISKMIKFWSTACRSRRIHIGFDETHDLGRGKFMDKYGWMRNFDIFNKHLYKVCQLCSEAGLKPMIWSDMYFRMGSKDQEYYDVKAIIPDDVKAKVPPEAQLVYWDYYHNDTEIYEKMLEIHQSFNQIPVMGSGLWTWFRLTYDHQFTVDRVSPCIKSCCKKGVKEFFFTMWGDDGAYCDFDSAFSGIYWGADMAYGRECKDMERLELLSKALKSISYSQSLIASEMNYCIPNQNNYTGALSIMLWDDPLLGYGWRRLNLECPEILKEFLNTLETSLSRLTDLPYIIAAGNLIISKLKLRSRLLKAYRERNTAVLYEIRKDIPTVISQLDQFAEQFRIQWFSHYKPNGIETIQVRLGGQISRFKELALRLDELANGTSHSIPELDAVYDPRCNKNSARYVDLITAGLF